MHTISAQLPNSSKRAGFTLIEVLVAMMIVGIAMSAILGSMVFAQKSLYSMGSMTEANEKSRHVMYQLGYDLRSTTELVETGANKLSVKVEAPDGSLSLITYEYVPSAGILTRTEGGHVRYLSVNMMDFKFAYFNSHNQITSKKIDTKKISVLIKQKVEYWNNLSDVEYRSARFLLRNRLAA